MPEFEESKGFKLRSGNKSPFKQLGSSPFKVDPTEYQGDTESSTANRNIRRGKQEKQRTYVEGISDKLGGTKKQKRAEKRIMNKSEKIRKRSARQLEREKRTGSKEGKGVVGKIRKKVIDATQKGTTKKINKQMDKLTYDQAFNVSRRYVPGKTFTYKGESGKSEKTGSEVKPKSKKDPWPNTGMGKDEEGFFKRKDGGKKYDEKVEKKKKKDKDYKPRREIPSGTIGKPGIPVTDY
tara:strand:+ start:1068 stop:1778 length:711 start_codon:yes stop_codon:yes gene_type:complete